MSEECGSPAEARNWEKMKVPFLPFQKSSQGFTQGWTSKKTVCDGLYCQLDKTLALPVRNTWPRQWGVVLIALIEVARPILKVAAPGIGSWPNGKEKVSRTQTFIPLFLTEDTIQPGTSSLPGSNFQISVGCNLAHQPTVCWECCFCQHQERKQDAALCALNMKVFNAGQHCC